jgi:hypothetical protein
MVIPWHGFPLATLINKLEPLPSAKFIKFQTLLAPDRMPEQRRPTLHWPYTEGLRMDEAMNELTLMAVGCLRQRRAGTKRRADPSDHTLEVRVQRRQGHREDRVHGQDAGKRVDGSGAQ